jgi:DNA-directed RNA polymerase delta subunit
VLAPADACEDEVSEEVVDKVVDETILGGGPYPPQVEVDDSKMAEEDEVDEDEEVEEEEEDEDEDVSVSGGGWNPYGGSSCSSLGSIFW